MDKIRVSAKTMEEAITKDDIRSNFLYRTGTGE